jgi:RNA 2',3'-cyclic 3'-phosphodiesterase
LMSSKESVGGGPYVTEEAFDLREAGTGTNRSSVEPIKSFV